MWLGVFPPTSCSLKEICLPFSPHFPLPIPPTPVRSCWQPHPRFSLVCLSRGYGSHSLLLALVWRKLAPEHGCLSRACAELGRQVWVSLTYRWPVTDITQDRCQHKRRRMKSGEMPLGRENEDKTHAGGDGHCNPMASERGSSGRRCCISHLGATSTRVILIELVGFLPVPGRMGGWEAKGKCSAWAGLLDSPVLLKEQPRRAEGLLSAGSPALGPVSALRLPPPGSAEARPAASHPYWKRKNVAT